MLENAIDDHNDYERQIGYEQGAFGPSAPHEVAELLVLPQGSTMATMTVSITAQISVAEETLVVVETLVTVGSSPRFIVGFQHASQA